MQMFMKVLMMLTVMTLFLLLVFTLRGNNIASPRSTELNREYFSVERDKDRGSRSKIKQPRRYDPPDSKPVASRRSAATKASRRYDPPDSKPVASRRSAATKASAVEVPTPPPEPIRGTYPKWFSTAWDRSRTQQMAQTPAGDMGLFPECERRRARNSDRHQFIEPKPFLSNSKNPCWFEDSQRQTGFRCIPYFFIAGVAKCGTTDLYRRLRLHPEIMKGTQKEYHFWDRERFGNVEISEDGQVLDVKRDPWTFKEYTDRITGNEIRLVEKDIKTEGSSIKLFGDGSPSYLWDILNWQLLEGNQGCKEPRIVISQHIYHLNPKSKMILIFRHPTPRLYSRFLSRIWRTPFLKHATSETFHNYVKNGVKMYYECFKRWSIRTCAYNYTLYDNAVVRLVEGMYPIFVADWLRIWPRDQMLILRSEDYGTHMNETLEQAFNFLGVGKLTGEVYDQVMNWRLVNVGNQYDKLGPMKNETIKILDEFYQPFVDKFAELLQDRRFLWKDTYTPSLE